MSKDTLNEFTVVGMRRESPLPSATDHPTPLLPLPRSGKKLYLHDHSQLHTFLSAHPSFVSAELLREKIANVPKGIWIASDWDTPYEEIVAQASAQNAMPIFIVYNAIQRDLGGESVGGAPNLAAYLHWFENFVRRTGSSDMIVILEPDALPHMLEMHPDDQLVRVHMIASALARLRQNKKAKVYLDIGHPRWLAVEEAARLLTQFQVAQFDGFSLNVSHRRPTHECLDYGKAISEKVNGKHFVIDTSRNAIPQEEWCNPSPEGCGERPTFHTGEPLCDAYLWLKSPGESDGTCGGGPPAGTLWIDRAIMLATNAKQ